MDDIIMIIMSCDAFSDLWDGYVTLLEQNWPDRCTKTVIVTDKKTNKKYEKVDVFYAECKTGWSDRLSAAMLAYNSDYYFVTLDDYYLVKRINTSRIYELIDIIKKENIDYLRFFKYPTRATADSLACDNNLRFINTEEVYSVNLYPGIWRKEFLQHCLYCSMDIWQFEVSLAESAYNYNAKCVVNLANDFEILDVVRKGKFIRAAGKYIKKQGLYSGNRETNGFFFELGLGIKVFARRHLPDSIRPLVRDIAIRCGMTSYSNGDKNSIAR